MKPLTLPALSCRVATRHEAHKGAQQAYATAWQLVEDGRECSIVVTEHEDDITVKQRGFLHAAVLPQIAEQVVVEGTRYTADVWKTHLKDLFLPDTWESRRALVLDKKTGQLRKAKRATPHRIRHSTEELGIKGYSKFIDDCIDHATLNWGVVFVFRPSERDAVRYVRKVRKPVEKPAKHMGRAEEAVPA